MSELSSQVMQTESEINRADNALVAVKGKIEQQFERIEFLKNRLDELQKRKVAAAEQIAKLQEQSSKLTERTCRIGNRTCKQTSRFSNRETRCSKNLITSFTKSIWRAAALEADLQDEKSGIIDIVRRTAQLHNEIQSISVYRNNLSGQKDRLSTRASAAKAQLEQLLTEKAQQQARHGEITQVLAQLQENLDAKRATIEELSTQTARDNQELVKLRESRIALQSERSVLADMEKRHEGLNKGVKAILAAKDDRRIRLCRWHPRRYHQRRCQIRRRGRSRPRRKGRFAGRQQHKQTACRQGLFRKNGRPRAIPLHRPHRAVQRFNRSVAISRRSRPSCRIFEI